MTIFWLAIITFIGLDGELTLVGSKQKDTYAECQEMVTGETGKMMRAAIESEGMVVTGLYCVPVTPKHGLPLIGEPPT